MSQTDRYEVKYKELLQACADYVPKMHDNFFFRTLGMSYGAKNDDEYHSYLRFYREPVPEMNGGPYFSEEWSVGITRYRKVCPFEDPADGKALWFRMDIIRKVNYTPAKMEYHRFDISRWYKTLQEVVKAMPALMDTVAKIKIGGDT